MKDPEEGDRPIFLPVIPTEMFPMTYGHREHLFESRLVLKNANQFLGTRAVHLG
jgi:hypothetical protein